MSRFCFVLLAIVVGGCGGSIASPVPTTHPVKGKLLNKAGQPVAEGMIEFVSTGATPTRATAELAPDGTFALSELTGDGKKHDGASEGEYKVTYVPRMTEQQTEQPVVLPGTKKVVAGQNEFELKLP